MKSHLSAPKKFQLANGTRLLLCPDTRFETASVAVCILGGLRSESPVNAGITHLLEHLVFKRTERSTPIEIAERLDSFGGEINGFTDAEMMCLHGTMPGARVLDAVALFAELLTESKFSKEDFAKECDVVRQEMLELIDDPADTAYRGFCRTFWPGSMLAEAVCGSEESLRSLTPEKVRAHLREILVGSRIVIAVSGAFDESAVLAEAERLFGGLPIGSLPRLITPKTGGGLLITERPVQQVHVMLGCPWPHLLDPLRVPADMIVSVLGDGMSSRFFQSLREDRGLVYDIHCNSESFVDTAAFEISAVVDRSSLGELLRAIKDELTKLTDYGVLDRELERVKQIGISLLALERDSKEATLWRAIESENLFGRYVSADEDLELLQKVSRDDCAAVLSRFLLPGSFCASFAGELSDAEVEDELIRWCSPQ